MALAVAAAALAVPAAAQADWLSAIHTPSGNIRCVQYRPTLVCGMFHPALRVTLNPTGWATMEPGSAAGLPAGGVLAYGWQWTGYHAAGPVVCSSRFSGLTCRSAAGHGFFLSVQSQRVF